MIEPAQIPDEVVEAAAKRHYEECCELSGITRYARKWKQLTPDEQNQSRACARAAIAAALSAWPGMTHMEPDLANGIIILPLAAPSGALTENPDAEA